MASLAQLVFMAAAITPDVSRADECDAIEDAHAFNLCLAAHGPVYRPKTGHAPIQPDLPESEQAGGEQAISAPRAPSSPGRQTYSRNSPFLNLRPVRSAASARAQNALSLFPEFRRHPNSLLSQKAIRGDEQVVNPGLGSGRLP
jgi:hypothetical protein